MLDGMVNLSLSNFLKEDMQDMQISILEQDAF